MQKTDHTSAETAAMARPQLMPFLYGLAGVNALLMLLQAVLAGQWFAGEVELIETHGWIGNGFFLLAILQAVLVLAVGSKGRWAMPLLVLSGLIVLAVAGQLGLGYSGRESADAAGWHIANGVLLTGASVAFLCLLPRLRERA